MTHTTWCTIMYELHHSQDATDIALDEKAEVLTLTFADTLAAGTEANLYLSFTGILNDKMAGFYRSGYTNAAGEKVYDVYRYIACIAFAVSSSRR